MTVLTFIGLLNASRQLGTKGLLIVLTSGILALEDMPTAIHVI